MQISRLTTEGDVEGRSTRTVGYFIGTPAQIVTHCIENNIKPYYKFKIENIEVNNLEMSPTVVEVKIGIYGELIYTTPKQLEDKRRKVEALSKLTEEDKKILGLKE